MTIIPRSEYMANRVTYDAYYGQFVTDRVYALVEQFVGIERIMGSKDPHFNDIPLKLWDTMYWIVETECAGMLKRAGDFMSYGTATCITKTAARQIKADILGTVSDDATQPEEELA